MDWKATPWTSLYNPICPILFDIQKIPFAMPWALLERLFTESLFLSPRASFFPQGLGKDACRNLIQYCFVQTHDYYKPEKKNSPIRIANLKF